MGLFDHQNLEDKRGRLVSKDGQNMEKTVSSKVEKAKTVNEY